MHLWPKTCHPHDLFIYSQLGLISRSWWTQRPLMALTTSRCRALLSVAGPGLRSAGWSTAFLLQIIFLLWTWVKLFTQTAPPPWAASSASPPSCRMRTAWPVWSNTQPSQPRNSPESGWKRTVSPHSQQSVCVVVFVVLPTYCIASPEFYNHASWLSISQQHNNFLLLIFHTGCAFSLCSTYTVTDHKSHCTVQCIHVGVHSFTGDEHMKHYNAATTQQLINTNIIRHCSVQFVGCNSLVHFF